MHRVTLNCEGVPSLSGADAAAGITQEFKEHRTHFHNVQCRFLDGALILVADSDFDSDGVALMDEFSDLIAAFLPPFDGDIRVVSSEPLT